MKYVIIIVRLLLGLVFAVFGSNAFLHFIPMPPMQGLPGDFMGALIKSGYIYPIATLQVLGGLLLLLGGRFVALGLTLLGPVIVNIVLYHIFLDRRRSANGDRGLDSRHLFALGYRYKFPAIFQP